MKLTAEQVLACADELAKLDIPAAPHTASINISANRLRAELEINDHWIHEIILVTTSGKIGQRKPR